MTMLRNLLAIRLMLWTLALVSRRDDARTLRIAIPLTAAMAETMEGVTGMDSHAAVLRSRLEDLRDTLARLDAAGPVTA